MRTFGAWIGHSGASQHIIGDVRLLGHHADGERLGLRRYEPRELAKKDQAENHAAETVNGRGRLRFRAAK